ncbi:hypothetical protein LPUS_01406 [Lasallia pustulata]|uniref:Uncharacterized protein n=1 Tax=Lasallia pustulata TaxID=136370 RepID=A0A1W5DBI7_9LECA|nr:hypothetical protein LPUS_01406 [Lasallia pustulata]
MGQSSSLNRGLRSAAQTSAQEERHAQRKPNTSTHDISNTSKQDLAVVIGTTRPIPPNTLPMQYEDTDKRRLDQLHDLERVLQRRDAKIERYKKHHTELLEYLQQFEGRYKLLESRNAEAEDALKKMHEKAGLLQSQLQECKDDLFRLQPLNQISDSTILQQYEILNQQIASWIDTFFCWIDGENALREASGRPLHPHFQVEDASLQGLFASSPNAAEYWLRGWLHSRLQMEVFVEGIYLSCLPEDYVELIKVIEQSMRALKPKRGKSMPTSSQLTAAPNSFTDSSTIDSWRSETLAALANHPRMISLRSAKALHLARQIYQPIMSAATEGCHQPEILHSLHERIVIPAMELALNIQLTLGRYYFSPCMDSISAAKHRFTLNDISAHSVMIDISTRRTLKDKSLVILADDGTIGAELLVLEPSLLRRGRGGNPDVLMRKVVYLVELDRPLGKSLKGPVPGQKA